MCVLRSTVAFSMLVCVGVRAASALFVWTFSSTKFSTYLLLNHFLYAHTLEEGFKLLFLHFPNFFIFSFPLITLLLLLTLCVLPMRGFWLRFVAAAVPFVTHNALAFDLYASFLFDSFKYTFYLSFLLPLPLVKLTSMSQSLLSRTLHY